MNLSELPNRSKVKILEITQPYLRTKLMEMGVVSGVEITLTLKAPFRGPIAFRHRNTQISIRLKDAECILVDQLTP
ncbi:MAG: ferrous iron transport protein A [Bacteroidetes bacterium]|nr:ferrous iron transport protein A [Bacteroidota bacterium]MBM3424187.1 ferrous iron transport protein A [Bacteroidota bacterium]